MRNKTVRMLCEGGLSIALSVALSYVELDLWFQGGSISVTMLPLVLFAIRWGAGWGVLAGLAFGTLKYFLGEGFVLNWVSILFDYSVAYAMVGLAGIFKRRPEKIVLATVVGGFARFIVHRVCRVDARCVLGDPHDLPLLLLRALQRRLYAALHRSGGCGLLCPDQVRSHPQVAGGRRPEIT